MVKKAKVTTRDIASACGISQTTVSMILSNKEGTHFSKETVEKVRSTAQSMGYQYKKREAKAENLASRTILILVPSLSSQYYTTIISAVTEYASKHDLNTSVGITMREKRLEDHYLQLSLQSGFYGIICTYPPKNVAAVNAFYKKSPFVLMSDYNPDLHVGLTELDSYKSGELVADYLISLGHKEIAYMTTPLNAHEIPRIRRFEGMKGAYRKAGLDESSVHLYALTDNQWQNYCIGNRYYDAGRILVDEYLKNPSSVTAFVGNNDIIAIGVMDSLLKLGYRIPEDFSVCGYDNTLPASFHSISLTSVDHCIEEKGKDAVNMLRSQKRFLSGKSDKKSSPMMRISYDPQLFIRESTGLASTNKVL